MMCVGRRLVIGGRGEPGESIEKGGRPRSQGQRENNDRGGRGEGGVNPDVLVGTVNPGFSYI